MAILGFTLAAILIASGLGAWVASLNLLPTEMGLLYAACGVVAICSGCVVLAIAALIVRVGRLEGPPLRRPDYKFPPPLEFKSDAAAPPVGAPSAASVEKPAVAKKIDPVPPPPAALLKREEFTEQGSARQVVGRYSAGRAQYVVFSDGGIEAETEEGAFRFASMSEFKAYIANRSG